MAGGKAVIEAACASLVREYLSRKGLKGTLQKMDEEFPRNELSISNRQTLMKHVHLDKLMRRNKEEQEPLEAMLEIMTRYFMEHIASNSVERMNGGEIIKAPTNGDKSDFTCNHQTSQPVEQPLMKSIMRPDTVTLAARRERDKFSSDLIMDEDVEGETLIGGGRSGVMALETMESSPQYATKSQSSRPLSAKQGGGIIFSNDHALATRRRSQPVKLSRAHMSQQGQQKISSTSHDGSSHSSSEFLNDKGIMNNITNASKLSISAIDPEVLVNSFSAKSNITTRKSSSLVDPPASFEALLLKGEERANLLHRKGLDVENSDSISKLYKVENSSMVAEKFKPKQSKLNGDFCSQNSTKMVDLEFEEVEDIGYSTAHLEPKPVATIIQKPMKLAKLQSAPVDLKTAITLKNIVLGSPTQQYSDEWLLQSFSFCEIPDLKYGIVQKKGGPCGVLAAVQACLLQEMLFGENKLPEARFKNPSRTERSKALAAALSHIFWRAGGYSRAVVTIPSQNSHVLSSTKFRQDGVTEQLNIYTFTNFDELLSFLIQLISQFESDGSPGVILTVYSAILSRKSHLVYGDFDVPEQTTLIGSHGYCTQELVNLLLTGRAVSNAFNDIIQLDSGGIGQAVTLKGISSRSEVGFLSLFEHYKSCQIGTYYKTPKNPIWVICSESHFTILFSTCRDLINDWKAERRFDLIYYDGLAKQQEETKLTVSTINNSYKPVITDDDLVPPLEHCIRTKWEDAEIDWNGCEPIL